MDVLFAGIPAAGRFNTVNAVPEIVFFAKFVSDTDDSVHIVFVVFGYSGFVKIFYLS